MDTIVRTAQGIWEKLKNFEKKLERVNIKEGLIFAILLMGIAIALTPMLMVAKYNVPSADDYSYGASARLAWRQSHLFSDVLEASTQGVKRAYFGWSGLYSTVFLAAFQPTAFGENWYALTTYIMLISLCGGIVCLSTAVFRRILNATWCQTGIAAIVISVICTQLPPLPVEGFYWYAGSVCYTFFFGISLILYAKILTYIRLSAAGLSPVKKAIRLLSLSVLSAIIAGSNFTTALTTAILFVCALFFLAVQKKRSGLGLVVPFCVFMIGFAVAVLAPGNSMRQAAVAHRPLVLPSIFLSFCAATYYVLEWLSAALIVLVIFLLPLLYKIAARTKYSYPYPALVLLGSFCLFSAMFCPHIYAAGKSGPGRLLNIIYYAFVILLILDLFYVLGWYRRKLEARGICAEAEDQESRSARSAYSGAFLFAIVLLSLAVLSGSAVSGTYYTSGNAVLDLVQGHASAYYDTAMERVDLLTDDSQQDVVLPRYPVKPRVLYSVDISTDPSDWHNTAMSDFYQKNSVVLEPEG